MSLLQEALDACAALTRRVEHLEYDKVAQALEIKKLKRRVKKLKKGNRDRVLKLRRLKKVRTSQRIDTSDDTVMEDASNEGRIIDENKDDVVALMDDKEEDKKEEEAKVVEDDQEDEPTKVQEVVDAVTIAKLTTEVVTAAIAAASTRRRKGVVIRDPKEELTTSSIIPADTKSKDKGKGIMVEELKPLKKKQQVEMDEEYARKLHDELNKDIDWDVAIDHVKQKAKEDPAMQRYQVMKKRPQTEAQARKNMITYLKNVAGFRLDYFKGMSYDDIRPIFEAMFNSNIDFLLKIKEQIWTSSSLEESKEYTWSSKGQELEATRIISIKTEFPAIVFNDNLTSNETPYCEPTISSLNDEIDFRISFDEFDDEDYTVVFDKNSFYYKIISTNDLETNLENYNKKVNKPLFLSPEPMVSCIDNLDFFKDFENEFPAIVYNDALTSKSNFSTEPTLCPKHMDEFDFKDETSLSKYDEEEQNVSYFNDLFPFNIIYLDDLKLDKGNDDNKIDMIQSSRGLHTAEEMKTVRFGVYWAKSARQIPDKGDLRDYWIRISFAGYFLGTAPSYTSIRDPILRLCHRLIACSITGRSQAPRRYLRLFASGRKQGGMLYRGQFVARLAEHFGLVIKEEIYDTWAWVAPGPERQLDATTGTTKATEDAPAVDEVIMEYLVKIDQKARILELKQRYFKDYCSDNQYAVSIKEDMAYLSLHSPKTMKETRSNTSMDDPNITMEEYIRLEEEKAKKHGKVFNWETAKYGKIRYDEDVLDLRSIETEFPAIIFNDNLISNETPSCEPMNKFSAIVYNGALTSKSDFSTELTLCPKHMDEFDFKDETSLSKYDEEEQNVSYFNDLFPFNIIYLDDLKSDKGNDDNKINMIQSLGDMALPPRDQRHLYLRFEGLKYTEGDIADIETRYRREVHIVHVFNFGGLSNLMAEGLSGRMLIEQKDAQGQSVFTSRAWRSQAHEKVTVTDLFYLRRMDVGSVNVPYLLARYLRLFASRRKQGVASRPKRYPNATAGALKATEDGPAVDEGAQADPVPVWAPQPPPPPPAAVSPVASASAGAEGHIPPKTAKQKLARKNKLKAKSTLMLAIPDEHLLKFHACKDAKSLLEAIKNSQEGLDKTYDRFHKLISQLEVHGEVISQEDANMKLLRSLPSAWNNIALIMRNKSDLDTLSMDNLYNNRKVYEFKIKIQSSSSLNSQNVAFVSSDNSSSTNETINTAYSVSAVSFKDQASTTSYADDVMFSFFSNQSNALQFMKKTGRKLDLNGKEPVGFDRIKGECYNCHRRCHFARECRAPRNQGNRNRDAPTRNAPVDTSTTNALVVQDGIESLEARIVVHEKNEAIYEEDIAFLNYDVQVKDLSIKEIKNQLENALKEKDDLKLKLEKFETSSKNLTKLINSQISDIDKTGLGYDGQMNEINDRFKKGEGYHAVPPPYTRNYMPHRDDLSFTGLDNSVFKSKVSETITSMPKIETNASKTSKDSLEKPKTVRPSAPFIEKWESDSEDENVFKPKKVKKTAKPSLEKIEFINVRNTTVENENKAKRPM
uniref:CCHC-type domain-containing protein n=1 Tax=Tanacetum cinerariifolium TaxID=118510 RepID=A0A699GMW8_TANCI|nr:hypothetical protein [Tanacetum cinerariifolium]